MRRAPLEIITDTNGEESGDVDGENLVDIDEV